MKINCLFLVFLFFLPLESLCQSDYYYDKNEFPYHRKTNFHLNVGYKYSFHYGRLVVVNAPVTNTSGRDTETLKQSPFGTFDISLTINHFFDRRQEVFGGFGVSEHIFEEEGKVVYYSPTGTSRYAFSDIYYYEHFYFVVGHRYTFPARHLFFPFIENSFQSDWLTADPSFFIPFNYYSRNGYSYKIQLGFRTIGEIPIPFRKKRFKANGLFSIFFQTAIVKYNVRKINRDYYPYAFGINFAMGFGK